MDQFVTRIQRRGWRWAWVVERQLSGGGVEPIAEGSSLRRVNAQLAAQSHVRIWLSRHGQLDYEADTRETP